MKLHVKSLLAVVFFAIWLALWSWAAQLVFFDGETLLFYGFMVWFFAWVFWLSVLGLPKIPAIVILLAATLLQIALIIYHHYFQEPLTLAVAAHQWHEAGVFVTQTPSLWSDWRLWIFAAAGMANLVIYYKSAALLQNGRALSAAAGLSLAVFAGFLVYTPESSFDKSYFKNACTNFGYGFCWGYEAFNTRNRTEALAEIHANRNKLPEVAATEGYLPPRHIYLIQVESLAYDVINRLRRGKEITPFLNRLSRSAPLYRVTGKPEGASANTDFAVNAGTFIVQDYGAIYKLYPPEVLYEGLSLLPKIAAEKGYYPAFFHNFSGDFYDRRPHMAAQGYAERFFYDDMLNTKDKRLKVEDGEMFAFIRTQQQKFPREKTFTYIITMSSHADYKVSGNPAPLIADPKNELEDYFNAINYVDRSLEEFVTALPPNSLVLIFGDHGVVDFGYDGAAFIVFDPLNHPAAENRPISFAEFVARVRSYLQ